MKLQRKKAALSLIGLGLTLAFTSWISSARAERDDSGMNNVPSYSIEDVLGFFNERMPKFNGRPELPCDRCAPWLHNPEEPSPQAPVPLSPRPIITQQPLPPPAIEAVAPSAPLPQSPVLQPLQSIEAPLNVNREPLPPGCKERYDKLYKNSVIDMRVVLGYMDTAKDFPVSDQHWAAKLAEKATEPCTSPYQGLCGFESPDEDYLYTKTITGPDGQPKLIKLTIMPSSYWEDDRMNRAERGNQDKQSRKACDYFKSGLSEAQVLLYGGHSRGGFGPDCGIPASVNKNGVANLKDPKYQTRSSIKEITRILENSASKPDLMGIISCSARQHFGTMLQKAAPSTGLVLPEFEREGFGAIYETIAATLDSSLAMRCESEFNENLRAASTSLEKPTRVSGFAPKY